nr:hypothetical protein [Tanacetum cinerariifolium]
MRVDNNVLGGLKKDVRKNQKIIVVAEENMADKKDQHKQGTTSYIKRLGKQMKLGRLWQQLLRELLLSWGDKREESCRVCKVGPQPVVIQPVEPVIGLGGVGLGGLVLLEKDDVVEEKLVLPVEGLVLPVEEEGLGFPVGGLAGEEEGLAGEEDPGPKLDNLHLLADTAIAVEDGRLSDVIGILRTPNGRDEWIYCPLPYSYRKKPIFYGRLSETLPTCQILDSRNCVEVYCQEHAFDHHITVLRHFYSIKSSVSDMCHGVKHALGILQVAVQLGSLEIIATCVDYQEASPREEVEEEDILKIIPG